MHHTYSFAALRAPRLELAPNPDAASLHLRLILSLTPDAHRDMISGSQFVTVSTDGRMLYWDYKNLSEPTDSVLLAVDR